MVHDILGLFDRFTPRFAKKYLDLHTQMLQAFGEYIADVTSRTFPAAEHAVDIQAEEWDSFLETVQVEEPDK